MRKDQEIKSLKEELEKLRVEKNNLELMEEK